MKKIISLLSCLFLVMPVALLAQNKMAPVKDEAMASLANKKFNLTIVTSDGNETIQDFLSFTSDAFESKAGRANPEKNARYHVKKDEKGTIHFIATIVGDDGTKKTYMGSITDNVLTGKYIVEPAGGASAISYAMRGILAQ
jgi:hypothetical protein